MKKISLFTFIFLILSVITLSGCAYAADISTELCINSDMSGYRKMYCQYSNTQENSNTVTDETIAEVIGNAIADTPLEYSKTSNGHELMLSFTSIEDYKQKVSDIFEKNSSGFAPEITILMGNSPSVYENFSSVDLLDGIIAKCNEYIAAEDSAASLNITANTSRLIIGDKAADIDSGEINYSFSSPGDLEPISITILNKITAADTISRTISMVFDESNLVSDKAYIDSEITAKLDGLSANHHWDSNTLFIEYEGKSELVKKITEAALDCTDELSLELSSDSDLTFEKIQLNENIIFSSETELNYCIENDDSYAVGDIWGRTNSEIAPPEKDGSTWYIISNGSVFEIGGSIEHRTYAQQAFVTLQNRGNGNYIREYCILFSDVSNNFLSSLRQDLDSRVSENICRTDGSALYITFEGDIERINKLSAALFGSENVLTLESDFSPFNPNSSFILTDNILLGAEVYTVGRTDDISYRYIPFDEKLSSPAEQTISNGSTVELTGSISNQYALLMLALSALAIMLIMLLIVLLSRRRSLRKTPKTSLPPGSYMTSRSVMVLPSDTAVKREEKQPADKK